MTIDVLQSPSGERIIRFHSDRDRDAVAHFEDLLKRYEAALCGAGEVADIQA